MKKGIMFLAAICFIHINIFAEHIFIEAESFNDRGGWVVDQQSMDVMGSSYLMAHGLGVPVQDAKTTVEIHEKGDYKVWVRTRNWAAPWNSKVDPPGKFQLLFNNNLLTKTIFGTEGEDWHWQDGGIVSLEKGTLDLTLHDMTGFNGRCDAILLTKDLEFSPPNNPKALSLFRKNILGFSKPVQQGKYDLVVVGGGIAGITTAVSAARLGCKVALIQNRPVLGGNNSSEVRVGLSGLIFKDPYPNLGKLVDEMGPIGYWTLYEAEQNPTTERSKRIIEIVKKEPRRKIHNAGPKINYEDEGKMAFVLNEKNIDLFLNTHIYDVIKKRNKIIAVVGKDILTGKESIFKGKLFADCTGDATVGFLAGADFRVGRESKQETGEKSAPEIGDNLVMGTSIQWYSDLLEEPSLFPETPWAIQFSEETSQKLTRGEWNWEAGMTQDQVYDIERIRDHALRAVFGNWSYLKNQSEEKDEYKNNKLSWVAYIGGKRESRRLIGDVVIAEQDMINNIPYEDASYTTTWPIDLHYPLVVEGLENEDHFLSRAEQQGIGSYALPYRTLYSRNIDNLFMAGRNVSVTHIALGSVRVQRTTGMMGEVVGMAASLALKYNTTPRGVYKSYLGELKTLMKNGIGAKAKK
ncbi:MAG: FAD-dependent oxidoreductase [Bacteroidales bacterium]|mgnify:CR=1 FL=1|nr:FAD-dependent oxidoreductase [Bacteroidales bacterium]